VLKRLLPALALAACSTGGPAPQDGGSCKYDTYEGTCVLTNLWVGKPDGDVVVLEAQYETPRSTEIVRHEVDKADAGRWRQHLSDHARVACKGRVIESGSCEPSNIELQLPRLGQAP
jgi:hypothetical protein